MRRCLNTVGIVSGRTNNQECRRTGKENMDTFDKIMENSDDMITLQTDDGEKINFYVLEETKMNGETYLLVTDSKEEDGDCYLLRDKSKPEDPEASYEFVDDDGELDYMSRIFEELMSDLGVEIEK